MDEMSGSKLVETCDGLLDDINKSRSHSKLLRQKDHLVITAVQQVKSLSSKLEAAEARQLELQIQLERERKNIIRRGDDFSGNNSLPVVPTSTSRSSNSKVGAGGRADHTQLLFREKRQVQALKERLRHADARHQALELRLKASEKERAEIDTALLLKQEEVKELRAKLTMTQGMVVELKNALEARERELRINEETIILLNRSREEAEKHARLYSTKFLNLQRTLMRPEGQKQLKASASSETLILGSAPDHSERGTTSPNEMGDEQREYQLEVPADVLTERFLQSVAKHYKVSQGAKMVSHLKTKLMGEERDASKSSRAPLLFTLSSPSPSNSQGSGAATVNTEYQSTMGNRSNSTSVFVPPGGEEGGLH